MEEVPRRTSLVPLAFPCLGAGGDHFHCAVEPSPGHIRCRKQAGVQRGLCRFFSSVRGGGGKGEGRACPSTWPAGPGV